MDPGFFAGGGGGGGGVSSPDCQKTALTTFFLSPQLIFTVLQWFINGLYQRKLYVSKVSVGSNIFQGGGGGPTFPGGPIFPGGGV